jgi:hypothetical protein
MVWTASGWAGSWFYYGLMQTVRQDHTLNDPMKVALYNNTVTPNPAANANYGYGSVIFPPAAEVFDDPGWPAGGPVAGNVTVTVTGERIAVTADNVQTTVPATLPGIHGSMIYDSVNLGPPDAPDNPGSVGQLARTSLAFHWFGGRADVTGGQLFLLWGPDGIAVQTVPVRPLPPPRRPRRKRKAAKT